MCGICGKINFDSSQRVDEESLKMMTNTMLHRGPDDDGFFISGQVGLGHRRLSIIDLNTGKQPIANEDNSIWIVFNGEIYNYQEIKKLLVARNHFFKTETDTEVIIHAYEEYGKDVVSHLRGMFAFAIWDERERVLLLARDRVGIKPLYYSLLGNSLIFASEIKAILAEPSSKREINHACIDTFLTYYYTPGCETLFKNMYKLAPGHILTCKNGKTEIKKYWDLDFSRVHYGLNFEDAVAQLVPLLKETVRDHMISDVPIGFLLSGGVDSTALLSYAIEETNKEISTFTVGFSGEKFADERPYARMAASRFGTSHHEITISANDFWDFLPQYIWHMEEPVCEPPAVALYYVSRLAKDYVKVLLSGEGGDEAFAGYQNYRNIVWLERLKACLGPFNGIASKLVALLGHHDTFNRLTKYGPLLTIALKDYYYSRTSNPFRFFNDNVEELYSEEFIYEVNKNNSTDTTKKYFTYLSQVNCLNQMLYVDTKTWLPDDLLIKADKITMANSIELRVPFLDHKVLEFAASLPPDYKLKGFETKHILKKAFHKSVPDEILYRKKTGFPVPYESWIVNDFKESVYGILMEQRTLKRGYFQEKTIARLINDNLLSKKYSKEIFSLIVFELWHRTFIDPVNTTDISQISN